MSTSYVFPGQGSQFVGMGRELAQIRPIVRGTFERADEALNIKLSQLCWEGPELELGDTVNTQPAIFTHSLAVHAALVMSGDYPAPAFLAGHSLGEFSALCAAGALTFEDGVKLVRERGRLMKWAGAQQPGSMAAVLGLDANVLATICAEASASVSSPAVVVANDNCPGQIVISGGKEAVAAAGSLAKSRGAKRVLPLNVSIAAHSPLMDSVSADFAKLIEVTPFTVAQVPIIANTSVLPISHPDDIRAELCAQLTSAVRWTETVQYMVAQGVTDFIEIGPKDVLSNLIKRTKDGVTTQAIG